MRWLFVLLFTQMFQNAFAQFPADSIKEADVQKHLAFLASDSLKGRGNYTPALHQAAHYIAGEFAKAGAVFLPSLHSFYQPFTTKKVGASAMLPDTLGNYNPQAVLLNVVGVLPGKSKVAEAIIFSAHYDHVGMQKGFKDSVYNGANDNASGTAALIALMHYYAQRRNNERTLIFCAFAGEEIGLKGSAMLAQIINPDNVKALINLEMIGRYGAVGRNSFFITGAYRSNLAAHFKKALKEQNIKIKREPSEEKQLFMRSDNYPFALKGIPAHTIMSSDDDDGCYHQPCDETERTDIANMTAIIRAVAIGCEDIINGRFTPSRIRR